MQYFSVKARTIAKLAPENHPPFAGLLKCFINPLSSLSGGAWTITFPTYTKAHAKDTSLPLRPVIDRIMIANDQSPSNYAQLLAPLLGKLAKQAIL